MFSIGDTIKGDSKIDLSGYATKADVPSLVNFEDLKKVVAKKLDSDHVNHQHTINQIEQLSQQLNNKLNIPTSDDSRYSYNTILRDWAEIPYLENVKIPLLEITPDKSSNGYSFNVDATGDLIISYNDVVIASYNKVANTWILNGVNINEFINTTNAVLMNHYEAIMFLANKLNVSDGNTGDGSMITPQ